MLWVYGHCKCFNYFSAGTVFIRHNLTSPDVSRRQIVTYKDGPRTERGNDDDLNILGYTAL